MPFGIDRRELLRRAALAGIAALVPGALLPGRARSAPVPLGEATPGLLTVSELQTLEAIVDRFVPSDGNGPGAVEAGVLEYLDGALGDALAHQLGAYRAGLRAADAYALSRFGERFSALPTERQDDVMQAMEANAAFGFSPSSRAFFNLVREHVIEGMFGDPYYRGNAGFAGWDLIGYPGVKIDGVSAAEQALGASLQPVHRSAYDYPLFRPPPLQRGE